MLEGLEAVRKRPGMYIGSTDTRGLMHCVWEIIDNGVDEALAGHAQRVEVTLHADDSVEVYDDGRGIPTDKEPKTGLPGVEVVATKLHAGGKFGGGSYVATGGLHGVGLSVVNALSARMDIDVDRSPSQQGLSFHRGVPGIFEGDGPRASFVEKSGLTRKGKRVGKGRTGTRIQFWPDRQIFTKDAAFEFEGLLGRARQTSFIVPGLELVIRDLRGETPVEEKFRHDGGIAEYAEFLAHDEPVTGVIRLGGSDTFTETVPMLDALTGLVIALGLVGIVAMVLPGTMLILGALLVWAALVGETAGWVTFAVAATFLVLGQIVKYVVPGRRMKDVGVPGSTLLAGSLLGIVGFFVIPVVGLPLGFVAGVYVAELLRVGGTAARGTTGHALRAVGLSLMIELAFGMLAALTWAAGVVAT